MICIKCKKQIDEDSLYCKYCGKKQTSTEAPKPLRRANGMGNVSKLSGRRKKPWTARISVKDDHGKYKSITIGNFEYKREALNALEKVISEGGVTPLFKITISEVRELWKEKHYPQLTKSGIEGYENAWNYFEPIKNMKMADIKTMHFQKLIDSAIAHNKSRSTCEKIKQLASQLCKWAMQNDVINKNYATFVEIKAKESTKKEPFKQEELKAIWNYYQSTKNVDAACILLLCHTGLRINEFLSMKKSDYYDGCLHGGSKTEKGKDRIIPIPDIMLPIIKQLLDIPGNYLVSNSLGESYNVNNWRKRNYKSALLACGFSEELCKRRMPHSCRHTYATMCDRLGVDDKALQDILGHEDISTTMNIYTHTDIEFLKNAVKTIDFINIPASK